MQDRILVVDDEANARELFSLWLEKEDYLVRAASDGDEGMALVKSWEPDLVVLDLKMPPGVWGGLEVLQRICALDEAVPVVFVSNKADAKRAVQAIRMGAFDFIDKNDARDELIVTVGNALKVRHLEAKATRLEGRNRVYEDESKSRLEFGNLTGSTERMEQIFRTIEKVAPTDATILVTGETGTGKELVAGAIHYMSGRSSGPFIKMNCAALPEALLEDELFGHEKGAFTGATDRRLGRFELANGGTLFLDEIGDMALSTQAKVLRVIQEREFERVGGSKTVKVNVRVIAATNRNLVEESQRGTFRSDLYYRLNDITIRIPSLRERADDIPLLIGKFLEEFSGKYTGKSVSNEAMRALMRYEWPGNVRELKSALKNACILADSAVIYPSDLPIPTR